jgi:hypothetical protein
LRRNARNLRMTALAGKMGNRRDAGLRRSSAKQLVDLERLTGDRQELI